MNRHTHATLVAMCLASLAACAGPPRPADGGHGVAPTPLSPGALGTGATAPTSSNVRATRPLTLPDGNTHPVLPGTTIGLLVVDNGAWGPSAPGPNGTIEGNYEFHGPPGSAFWAPYFPSAGEGRNFLRAFNPDGRTDGPAGAFDCAMFGPTTRNRWGLARDVHLVAIEVNRGRGSVEGTMHFVGTDVRVLDGTSEYPFRPGEVLRSLRASYDAFVASSAARIDAALARARVEPPADLGPWTPEVEAREIGVHLTWNASTKRMTALFHTHIHRDRSADHSREPGFRPGPACSHLGRCGSRFSVAMGQESEVDREGRTIGVTEMAPDVSRE